MLQVIDVIEHSGVDHCQSVVTQVEVPEIGKPTEGVISYQGEVAVSETQVLKQNVKCIFVSCLIISLHFNFHYTEFHERVCQKAAR